MSDFVIFSDSSEDFVIMSDSSDAGPGDRGDIITFNASTAGVLLKALEDAGLKEWPKPHNSCPNPNCGYLNAWGVSLELLMKDFAKAREYMQATSLEWTDNFEEWVFRSNSDNKIKDHTRTDRSVAIRALTRTLLALEKASRSGVRSVTIRDYIGSDYGCCCCSPWEPGVRGLWHLGHYWWPPLESRKSPVYWLRRALKGLRNHYMDLLSWSHVELSQERYNVELQKGPTYWFRRAIFSLLTTPERYYFRMGTRIHVWKRNRRSRLGETKK